MEGRSEGKEIQQGVNFAKGGQKGREEGREEELGELCSIMGRKGRWDYSYFFL